MECSKLNSYGSTTLDFNIMQKFIDFFNDSLTDDHQNFRLTRDARNL